MDKVKPKCLNPDCRNKDSYCRGLCFACYQYVQRIIKQGRTTWEKLEGAGKALPVKGRSRTALRKWFDVEQSQERTNRSKEQ